MTKNLLKKIKFFFFSVEEGFKLSYGTIIRISYNKVSCVSSFTTKRTNKEGKKKEKKK